MRDSTTFWARCRAALLALPLLLAACGGSEPAPETPPPPGPTLTSITVSPADLQVGVGLTQTVTAQARDQNGALMAGVAFTWASSNGAVASVAQGVVNGVAAGTSTITASSGGVSSNPASVTVVAAAAGRVAVDKASLFLPATGQTAQLTAQVLDAQGAPVPGAVNWVSSAPDKVSVDAAGRVQALAIGSAQIFAQAGGVRSAPTLAIVATPQPGALLVTDAQIVSVGQALRLPPGAAAGVGTEYEVTLQGVAAPAVGSVVLAAESAPVAGKVVATRQEAAGLVVTLALAPLEQLFTDYNIKLDIALSAFEVEAVPDRAAAVAPKTVWAHGKRTPVRPHAAVRPHEAFEPFRAWDCDASIKPQLLSAPISLSLENKLNLVLEDRPGYSKHALEGSAEIVGSAGFKLKAGFKATGRCDAQGQIKLPVFGWFSAIVMPAVRFGLGAELEGEITLVQGELSIEGRIGVAPVLGWECGGVVAACRALDSFEPIDKLKTTSKIPSKNDMQVKVSAQFYVVAGLDASVFFGTLNAGIVEARVGPKQSFDLGFEEDQAAREDYAANYDLKLDGVIEPGAALAKAIEKVIGDDSTTVKFKADFSKDLSESPKGVLSVSKPKVRPDTPVDFTVEFTPTSTLEYWVLGYNVTGVQLWRRAEGEIDFTFWKAMEQIASNRATYRWTPGVSDAGKYEVAAFVNTQIDVPWLEVAPHSVKEVEVSCFSGQSAANAAGRVRSPHAKARGAGPRPQALDCADKWVGTATYIGKTPGLPTANITSRSTITWTFDPTQVGVGRSLHYKASGSFDLAFNYPDGCVAKLVPNQFTIVEDPQMARLTIFDDGFNAPSYGFGGKQLVDTTVTLSCPGKPDHVTEMRGFLAEYATGSGPYTVGQTTLSGNIEDAATTANWHFERP